MAAFMPCVMKSNAGTVPEKMVEIARALGVDVNAMTSSDAPDAAWRAVAGLAGQIGIPRPSSFGIDRATLAELARVCLDNPSSAGNPRPLDEAAYVELLEQAVSTDLW